MIMSSTAIPLFPFELSTSPVIFLTYFPWDFSIFYEVPCLPEALEAPVPVPVMISSFISSITPAFPISSFSFFYSFLFLFFRSHVSPFFRDVSPPPLLLPRRSLSGLRPRYVSPLPHSCRTLRGERIEDETKKKSNWTSRGGEKCKIFLILRGVITESRDF